jgi:hypothetical protein
MTANFLWGYLFGIAPVVIYYFSVQRTWPLLLAGLYALTVTSAVRFRGIHAKAFPGLGEERFTHFLIVMLSPASTVRAGDLLSRPWLERFHPLAAARVLCAPEEFQGLARLVLRELKYPALPVCPRAEPEAVEAEQRSRAVWTAGVERFLRQSGLSPEELLQPPPRVDENCRAFCPRCLAQFTRVEGGCADCGGVELAVFN